MPSALTTLTVRKTVLDAEEIILKLRKESVVTLNSDQDLSPGPSELHSD